MTPDAAANAMFAATGSPCTPKQAKAGMGQVLAERARANRERIFGDHTDDEDPYLIWTADAFQQDSIGRRHPARTGFGTTLLYKLIAGKRIYDASEMAA